MKETIRLIEGWAEDRNLVKGSTPQAQMVKLVEEMGELAAGIAKGDRPLVLDSIGDMVVVLTIIANQFHTAVDDCAEIAYLEIKDRKGKMVDGIFVKEEDYGR